MSTFTVIQLTDSDPDLEQVAAAQTAAFGDSPISMRLEPHPRAPIAVRSRCSAMRLAGQLKRGITIGFKAVDTEGLVLGSAIWNKPGYRVAEKKRLEDMDEDAKEAVAGLDMEYWNNFEHALQDGRDSVGIKEYWRLALLAVHPEHQRKGVGAKLIDTGLAIADAASLPAVLESTPAGSKLYTSRGFVTKGAAKVEGLDEPLPVMVRPSHGVADLH